MPAHELAFPVAAYGLKVIKSGYTYPLLVGTDTFTRTGADGAEIICPLFGGDEFVGEVLEGQWVKGWDANISAYSALVASGTLIINGVAAVAGTAGVGWLNSQHPLVLMDEAELTFELELPIDDTGGTADRDIQLAMVLGGSKVSTTPLGLNNLLAFTKTVDESGILMTVSKKINGTSSTLFDGSTYDDTSVTATGVGKVTLWRVTIHEPHSGTAYKHIHVYLKQADDYAGVVIATENELSTSPYDISDVYFDVVYPSYVISTQHATYFNTSNDAVSTYIRATYPDFRVTFECAEANLGKGEVKLFDNMGSDNESLWQRVRDTDHVFTGNAVLQNGLLRAYIYMDGTQYNPSYLGYINGTWVGLDTTTNPQLAVDAKVLDRCTLKKIISISPETITVQIKSQDSSTDNSDYYAIMNVTFERGKPICTIEILEIYPPQEVAWEAWSGGTIGFACGQIQTYGMGHATLASDSTANTGLIDNYTIRLSYAANDYHLHVIGVNEKPDGAAHKYIYDYHGASMYFLRLLPATVIGTKFYYGWSPIANTTKLYKEAEDATLGAGSATNNEADDIGTSVLLNAQNEYVVWEWTGVTDLPLGRYIGVARIRDASQVAGDVKIEIYNATEGTYRNEINGAETQTVTAAYLYYARVFDVLAQDAGDAMAFKIVKATATANTIYVDFFVVYPIGNGQSLPQDLTHNILRLVTRNRGVAEK